MKEEIETALLSSDEDNEDFNIISFKEEENENTIFDDSLLYLTIGLLYGFVFITGPIIYFIKLIDV